MSYMGSGKARCGEESAAELCTLQPNTAFPSLDLTPVKTGFVLLPGASRICLVRFQVPCQTPEYTASAMRVLFRTETIALAHPRHVGALPHVLLQLL